MDLIISCLMSMGISLVSLMLYSCLRPPASSRSWRSPRKALPEIPFEKEVTVIASTHRPPSEVHDKLADEAASDRNDVLALLEDSENSHHFAFDF